MLPAPPPGKLLQSGTRPQHDTMDQTGKAFISQLTDSIAWSDRLLVLGVEICN